VSVKGIEKERRMGENRKREKRKNKKEIDR
jgi:hypothetical protein